MSPPLSQTLYDQGMKFLANAVFLALPSVYLEGKHKDMPPMTDFVKAVDDLEKECNFRAVAKKGDAEGVRKAYLAIARLVIAKLEAA